MFKIITGALSAALLPTAALAHHPLGGETPATITHGVLSGIGHPVIGIDHFAFVLAVGLAAAFVARPLLAPLAFVLATLAGCLLAVAGVALPAAEIVIAASVALLGGIVLSGRRLSAPTLTALFALAGLFHGGAYAAAIIGAETAPLLAYLGGFAATQWVIAAGAALLVLKVWRAEGPGALQPRLAGAVIAGVGLTFLVEHAESMIFPAM